MRVHPLRAIRAEAHHLHEIEERGEAPETPFIAIGEVALFLVPVLLVIGGLAFAAYYVIG